MPLHATHPSGIVSGLSFERPLSTTKEGGRQKKRFGRKLIFCFISFFVFMSLYSLRLSLWISVLRVGYDMLNFRVPSSCCGEY